MTASCAGEIPLEEILSSDSVACSLRLLLLRVEDFLVETGLDFEFLVASSFVFSDLVSLSVWEPSLPSVIACCSFSKDSSNCFL